jgi:hypothetical protein
MSTHPGPSSEQAPQAIIPVRPAGPETARVSSTPVGLLRRTLGGKVPSRRTLGGKVPSRRTLGHRDQSRRTLGGRRGGSRRTLGQRTPPSRRALG